MGNSRKNNQNSSYLYENTISKGIAAKQIQDDLGTSQQYVSALLKGTKSIGKKMAKKLAVLYDLDETKLIFGNSTDKPENEKEDPFFNGLPVDQKLNKLFEQNQTVMRQNMKILEQFKQLQEAKNSLVKEIDEIKGTLIENTSLCEAYFEDITSTLQVELSEKNKKIIQRAKENLN